MLEGLPTKLTRRQWLVQDHGSTRIGLACPHCRQLLKVRLRKLQFGADLTCRLCRHEFSAEEVPHRPEVQHALARMCRIVEQRMLQARPCRPRGVAATSPAQLREAAEHRADEPHPLPAQHACGQGASEA
jgi:hypothetical protein